MVSDNVVECSYERLFSLQDAFRLCNRSLLVCVIMNDHAYSGFPLEGPETFRKVRLRVESLLEVMCRAEVSVPSTRSCFLLPDVSYTVDARVGAIRRWVSASLFDVRVPAAQEVDRTGLAGREESDELDFVSYAAVPWERVLAWGVYLPRTMCRRERYMVLASAFWEMSFCWLEYVWARERLSLPSGTLGLGAVSEGEREAALAEASSEGVREAALADGRSSCRRAEIAAKEEQGAALSSEMLFRASPADEGDPLAYLRKLCKDAEVEKLNRSYFDCLARDAAELNRRARADSLDLRRRFASQVAQGSAGAH